MIISEEKGLESLEVWQKSVRLAVKICKEYVPALPPEEKWCLGNQLRRAAQSIPANIAEGYGRYYYLEAVRFCYIARGSLEETRSHLVLANQMGYIAANKYIDVMNECKSLLQVINGYIGYLKQCKRGEKEPGAQQIIRELEATYNPDDDQEDASRIDEYRIDVLRTDE